MVLKQDAPPPTLRQRASALWRSLSSRVLSWLLGLLPVGWIFRTTVRWLAFGASSQQLQYVINICEAGAVPIARSALQAASLREVYARACDEGACTPELQEEIDETGRFLEAATEEALAVLFDRLDANHDGTVSLREALDAMKGGPQATGNDGLVPLVATPATLIEAMRRARTLQEELERAKVGLALAVDGAIAAVDQDGDGQISVEEALQAPSRVVGWLGVWREIVARGKL